MIWIADNRPHSGWSTNISAAYGLYSTFSLGFPPTISCSQFQWLLSIPTSTIVVYGVPVESDAANLIATLAKPCQPFKLTPRGNPPKSAVWFDIARP